ncbi:MAG TPA: molecular chaperone DnaK, partial [Bacteroidetes bacterium]|nr:molecular chaperone DnaK [Bacteroidota bacterium]
HVLQGERPMAVDNRTLGKFHLDGIPPAPRGIPQVEVTFDIDANGMLHVSAKDKGTSKEQSIRITSSSGLTKEEVEKMKTDAAAHSAEDKKKKEEIDLKNQADSLVFQTEKQLKEFGEKVSGDARSKIENAKEALKDAMKINNINTIKSAIDTLNNAWNEASTQMYQQATAAGAQPGAGPQSGPSEGEPKRDEKKVEDAQYEVVDDKNKK